MKSLAKFVSEHISDDTTRLILDKGRWPEIDMELAVNSIECRRKLKGKVKDWYETPDLVFPLRLSAEQCSSSATGRYKAELAERIAASSGIGAGMWKIADLTGGLGVDSWFFSKKAANVLYNEMQEILCRAAEYNFSVLGSSNISISNDCACEGNIHDIIGNFQPDIVYMDPARRSSEGKKVFLIEECTPDVLTIKDEIFKLTSNILLKLSPMADISMVCERLGQTCREVHVVAAGGECKELLIWMDREWNEEYTVHAIELANDYPVSPHAEFRFKPSEERRSEPASFAGIMTSDAERRYLFEPGKALMKAGAFNLISEKQGIAKLGRSTHYYMFDDVGKIQKLTSLGKVYRILSCDPLDKRTMKAAGKAFPKAEVTARNIPMDTDTLRKKTGVTSGDDAHIFGLKSDMSGNILLCTKRVFQ